MTLSRQAVTIAKGVMYDHWLNMTFCASLADVMDGKWTLLNAITTIEPRSHKTTAISGGKIPTNDEYPYPDETVTCSGHSNVVISTRQSGPFRNIAPWNLADGCTLSIWWNLHKLRETLRGVGSDSTRF